jgi:hypothetical protein
VYKDSFSVALPLYQDFPNYNQATINTTGYPAFVVLEGPDAFAAWEPDPIPPADYDIDAIVDGVHVEAYFERALFAGDYAPIVLNQVPEPSSLAMLLFWLGAIYLRRRHADN